MPAVVFFLSISTLTFGYFFSNAFLKVPVVSLGYEVTMVSVPSTAGRLRGAAKSDKVSARDATRAKPDLWLFISILLMSFPLP